MLKPKLFTTLQGYNRSLFLSDLSAGITVGFVALPLAMAFAIASGLPPERVCSPLLLPGYSSRSWEEAAFRSESTGAFVVIVSGLRRSMDTQAWSTARFWLERFDRPRSFPNGRPHQVYPLPVTTGFTTGIAVVIFTTQIKDLFGLQMPDASAGFVNQWIAYTHHLGTFDPVAAAVGIGTIILIVLGRRLVPRLPPC